MAMQNQSWKSDVWLMLLDSDYNKIWSICYGGSGDENLSEISFSKNNDIVFVANSNSSDGDITQPLGNTDVWLVKLDTNGTILQQNQLKP
ncbi:MAG: hypothetical protein IPP29_01285 [Bacteroidetes bacterium]|nr:hypothetical protein [Bacteroidota bacterium]